MGLFGSKENPEDLMYNAMSMMEKNQPKVAISLFNKILKQDSENDIANESLAYPSDLNFLIASFAISSCSFAEVSVGSFVA